MKKIVLVLMLLCCSFLYAENKTFKVNHYYDISFEEETSEERYTNYFVRAILPYDYGYIVKLFNTKTKIDIEYLVARGTSFYYLEREYNYKPSSLFDVVFYKCTVIDTKPNKFIVSTQLLEED